MQYEFCFVFNEKKKNKKQKNTRNSNLGKLESQKKLNVKSKKQPEHEVKHWLTQIQYIPHQ